MDHNQRERAARTLHGVRACLTQLIHHVDDLASLLEADGVVHALPDDADPSGEARIEAASFTVRWHGRRCHLGSTLAFKVMEQLVRSNGRYVPVESLLQDIWSGRRAKSTVRTAVSDLRHRLQKSGMEQLAARIDGRSRGYYGLVPLDG